MRPALDARPKGAETGLPSAGRCLGGPGPLRCLPNPTPSVRCLHPRLRPSGRPRPNPLAAALPPGAEAAAAATARLAIPATSSSLLAPPLADAHAALAAAAGALDDRALCVSCAALGALTSALTLAVTARFLLSFFPALEAAARRRRGPALLRALVVTLDPALLGPAQRRLFRMREEGDVNYAAMATLAVMSAGLELLFGEAGVLARAVPDADLLHGLNYLIYCQHMLLLPQWAMAVFRFYSLI